MATEETNCIVDFIDESLDIAKALRNVPETDRGPLFGVPLSVKECFFVRGYDATAGNAGLKPDSCCRLIAYLTTTW